MYTPAPELLTTRLPEKFKERSTLELPEKVAVATLRRYTTWYAEFSSKRFPVMSSRPEKETLPPAPPWLFHMSLYTSRAGPRLRRKLLLTTVRFDRMDDAWL